MNRYFLIHRLRWPMFLLLTGVIALLDQAHILSWGHAWPLYLIMWGVLALAERASAAEEDAMPPYPPQGGYPSGFQGQYPPQGPYQTPYPGSYQAPYQGAPVPPVEAVQETGIVQAHNDEITPRGDRS